MPTVSHRTRLLDHRIPSLYAGRYRITVAQDIATLPTGDTLPERTQKFDVRGLRLSLGATEVHACYPVPGALGKYSQILPHITLDAAGLPWARLPKGMPEGTPWVALLLFRETAGGRRGHRLHRAPTARPPSRSGPTPRDQRRQPARR